MLQKLRLFIIYIVFCVPAYAGQHKIDSLLAVLKTAKADTNKIKLLNHTSEALSDRGMYAASDSLAHEAIELSHSLNYPGGEASAYIKIGYIYEDQGNYDSALDNYSQSLEIEKRIGDKAGMGGAYMNIGNVYEAQGAYPEALNTELKALKIEEELGNKHNTGGCYINIGNIYTLLGNDADALKNYEKGLKIVEAIGDKTNTAAAYLDIGLIYQGQGKYKEALENELKSLGISEQLGDKRQVSSAYANIGTLYDAMNNYDEAVKTEQQSLQLSKQFDDKQAEGFAYENIGNIFTREKKLAEAKKYLDSAYIMATATGAKDIIKNVYSYYAALDSATGDFKGAFSSYKIYIKYLDSLKNEENTRKIVSEQMNYEFKKKEAIAKEEQEKKDAIHQEELNKQKIIIYSVTAGLVLVLLLALTIFRSLKQNRKKTTIIEQQKAVVEEKNKEILDSIAYARRLQDAILPPVSLIRQNLAEAFVLYKPKDIVAGDFYWMQTAQPQAPPRPSPVGREPGEIDSPYLTADPIMYGLLKEFVDNHRKYPTEAEAALWTLLKSKKTEGYKFRRQHIIGSYIVDFVCLKKKLVIEVDGLIHQLPDNKESDEVRTQWLKSKGYEVIRVKNEEVLGASEAVLDRIVKQIKALPDISTYQKALPTGEGWGGAGAAVFIAAADCTGHGVPGAMVSVVCSNALNRAIKEFLITETGQILDKVKELVLETFATSEKEVKDGMDISLCKIQGTFVQWSGAYNSLAYIQNGELREIVADKQPVGKHESHVPFTTHNLKLDKGDVLYLYTDGYADQFGGPKGKKLMYKKFREKLKEIANLPMSEQKQKLEEAFNEWKGPLEQVDDVLVIGIRL